MPASRRTVLVIACVALVVAGGAGLVAVKTLRGGVQETGSAEAPVSASGGGTVSVDGARLVVPPEAVSSSGTIIASTQGAPQTSGHATEGAAASAVSLVARPVLFKLIGTRLKGPVTVKFPVSAASLPAQPQIAGSADAVWMSFYNTRTHRWQPVASRYDPATRIVTARVPHLSWWAPQTWNWQQIAQRLRQSLAAAFSARAPQTDCAGVPHVTVLAKGGQDPPLIGCATADGTNALTVTLTSNRGYAMIVQAPSAAALNPPEYKGFEEYVRSRAAVTHALGGTYLAPASSIAYTLPLNGSLVVFTGGPSWKTYVLDQSIPAAEAIFDTVTLGYANCILDAVARSQPAPLSDAPGLIVECFPVLAQASTVLRLFLHYAGLLSQYVKSLLTAYDTTHDVLLGIRGQVTINRPAPVPDLYVHTGYVLGSLYQFPSFPAKIGLNNADWIGGLQWAQASAGTATATGVLHHDTCNPSCAAGNYVTYSVGITASSPQNCTVQVYPYPNPNNDPPQAVTTYVFNDVTIRGLSGNLPAFISQYPQFMAACK